MKRTKRSNRYTPKTYTPILSSQTIHILNNSWKKICEYNPILPELVDINHIQTGNMYIGIPEEIRREFESTSQRGVKMDFILPRGRKVIVSILVPMNKKDSRDDFIDYLTRVLLWLHFIDEVASPKCAQTLNIYLLLTDAKKKLPENDEENIDMIHANTAFTTSCSTDNSIFLFRREEWFKVFIHETFHCFGLDFSSSNGNGSNDRILSIFPALHSSTNVSLYETFCEIWAEIFYMMFVLFYKSKCLPFRTSPFLRILTRERLFSIYQSNKILHRSGYQYDELFAVPSRGKNYYTENTPAFSYYVIKSLMLWNFDRFMEWCVKYSDVKERGYPPIQFHIANIPEYCDFVEELTKNDGNYTQMTKIVEKMKIQRKSKTLKRFSPYPYTSSYLERTLRMTSIDM